jgi:serine/threonine protein kinase
MSADQGNALAIERYNECVRELEDDCGLHSDSRDGINERNISDYVIDLEEEYEFVERIGESRKVELWRNLKSSEEVVVKTYQAEGAEGSGDNIEKTFIREVEALVKLKHPCILSIKGYCLPRGDKGARLVTDLMGNGSLKPILCEGPKAPRWWTVGRKVTAILGIVLGMKYIHFKGFIHRDLKPENVFVDDDHRIRIGDFGSSRLYEASVTMTSSGTPLYMAPESGESHYDSKIDVYSFGLIMYEIVTNDPIFSGPGNKLKLLGQLQSGWRPDLNDVTPLSRSIIERSWSMSPDERPSFEDIWRELYVGGFDIIPGVKKSDIKAFLTWFETEGGKVERFDC